MALTNKELTEEANRILEKCYMYIKDIYTVNFKIKYFNLTNTVISKTIRPYTPNLFAKFVDNGKYGDIVTLFNMSNSDISLLYNNVSEDLKLITKNIEAHIYVKTLEGWVLVNIEYGLENL